MLGSFCMWPTREKIRQHAPACFKVHYSRCRGIVDATEIKVQAPFSMVLNSEMYSSYKTHTTYKGNVVLAPSGEIIHVSALFEGSISDKELVKRSGLFPLLESSDQPMADKGFDIKGILEPIGCEITIPAFLVSKVSSQKKNFCTAGLLEEMPYIDNPQVPQGPAAPGQADAHRKDSDDDPMREMKIVNMCVGRNIEDDPAQEISNRCSKSVVQRMGPNKTINSISKVCKATTGLQQITQQFDLSIGIHKTSVQHTTRDSLKDEKELVADLIQLDHFNHVPARSHDSFPDIKKLRYLHVVDFHQWLDKHKRELST
ncbi:hypothetical protein ACROYT_G015667 [Oculina patagonica]